jgi:serine/threonine protein kinase
MSVVPGQMLGRYKLLTRVGQGGMGAVFTAFDPDLGRTVAIKLLHSGVDDQRLEREARGLAKLSHPNVIAVYDVGRAAGRLFVAMEFVQGRTLRKWREETKPTQDAIFNVFLQAGRGLEAAHHAGLVHRDFKPDNVLVGDDGRVRVLDFGLVEAVASAPEPSSSITPRSPGDDYDSASGAGRLTANGSVLGTPAYMALEQYSGAADPRTDQYSYCVTLWEALYGSRPYEYSSVVELLARLRSGPPPEAPRDSDVPVWIERLLIRGLSRLPDARFSSMSELLQLLEESLGRMRAREALIGLRYRLLGSGSGAIAAIDTFTDQQVLLEPCNNPRDFQLLGSFEHPNIVPVVDVARSSEDRHYLVLELGPSHKTFSDAAASAPLSIQLEWMSELLRALHYLHHRRVGHPAFSEDEVVIAGGHLRLLVTRTEPFSNATVSSDLALVAKLMNDLPSLSSALRQLVNDWRDGTGAAPAQDAALALEALSRAAERQLPVETAETRESWLRALPLLGRTAVNAPLYAGLDDLARGRGSAFWLEGESGVGKSRLLEELRRAAIARDVFVLEGRGEASAPSPYRVFRLPLLRLALRAGSEALDDFQLEALTPLIPELPARLTRTVRSATRDEEPSHEALNAVALALLRQERAPVVLLLEDLQWSGSESFSLLAELVSLTDTQPLMIVATSRNEQLTSRAAVPGGMRTITLERLTEADVSAACTALIGSEEPAELASLLFRETEGNAFFLVEALRALAEDAGSLAALKHASLPKRIFAGGIQTLLRRHLAAISPAGRPLLQLAAVRGRGIDELLLCALEPNVDVAAWMNECLTAAVFERVEAGRDVGVRFRHDKLREALLDEIPPEALKALHARVAAALEQTRGDDPEQLAALAAHFRAAGDAQKELSFATRAGEQALRSRAYTEAEEFLERAVELAERIPRRELLPELRALQAELHAQRSEWPEAHAAISEAFAAAGRPLWEKKLGNVLFFVVQLVAHLLRSETSEEHVDVERKRTTRALVRAADVQLNIALTRGNNLLALASSLLALNISEPGRPSMRALLLLALAARVARLREVTRRYISLANSLLPLTTDRKELAEALSYCGYFWVGEGKLRRAREYLLRGVAASTSIGYQQPLSWSVGQLSMCASLQGRFVEMLQQAEMCERHAPAGEATHVAARCTQVLALIRLGRLDEAGERKASLGEAAAWESPLTLAIRHTTGASFELARGRLAEALELAARAHRALPWASQVPPVWPDVLTAPIEVYLSAWQASQSEGSGDLGRLSRVAKRRIASLRAWARIYPVAQPMADYFSARAAELSGREQEAATLFERARSGAEARGLRYYERLATEALGARRALASSAM